ncbi:MAG: tRNA dihydrouridine synthase DusB [Tissierellia bacterium]|nr:tRNA dihydrouridine synthase DusB [Tissierellia bacterium]
MVKISLAPMAGFTDRTFREICASYHLDYMVTEMVSAKALVYGDRKTKDLLNISKEEGDVAVQIFGSDPAIMKEAAAILNDYNFSMVDINMGCPAPKIVKNGSGSALLRNPPLVYDIVKAVVEGSNKPVSVKIRKGIDGSSALFAAKEIEQAGASLLTVHGRTREQFYQGKADWKFIKKVKRDLRIPVFGNGDIDSFSSAKKAVDETEVDGISIGRGAIGNPFIFDEIYYGFAGMDYPPPTWKDKLLLLVSHLEKATRYKGERLAVVQMRKIYPYYFKGLPQSKEVRLRLNGYYTLEECIHEIDKYISFLEERVEI